MHPGHDGVTIPRPAQPQGLAPHAPLLGLELLVLLLLGVAAAGGELPLARRPPLLPAPVHELGAVLLEDGDGEEGELVVPGQLGGGAGDDHGGEGFVRLEPFLDGGVGDGDEVLLQVLGRVGREEVFGVHDRGERALREVACSGALRGGERGLGAVVLVEFGFDVVVYAGDFLAAEVSEGIGKGVEEGRGGRRLFGARRGARRWVCRRGI